MVDRVGQLTVAVESVNQENTAVAPQRAGHPDGNSEADREIGCVTYDDKHSPSPSEHALDLNVFKFENTPPTGRRQGNSEHVQIEELFGARARRFRSSQVANVRPARKLCSTKWKGRST